MATTSQELVDDYKRVELTNFPVHPLVTQLGIPTMTLKEFEDLKASIKAEGQTDDIIVVKSDVATMRGLYGPDVLPQFNGDTTALDLIVDGLHRYAACNQLKIAPRVKQWNGKGSLLGFVMAKNTRRSLTPTQRALIAQKALAVLKEQREATKSNPSKPTARKILTAAEIKANSEASAEAATGYGTGAAADKAAAMTGASPTYVKFLDRLDREAPDLKAQVEAGDLTVPQAQTQLKERRINPAARPLKPGEGDSKPEAPQKTKAELAEEAANAADDAEFVAGLPLIKKITSPLAYEAAALAYRRMLKAISQLKFNTDRFVDKRATDGFSELMLKAANVSHPLRWKICVKCRGKQQVYASTGLSFEGEGQTIECQTCKGNGFTVN